MSKDKPDIFADALASQIDAIRRAAFDECIAIAKDYEGISAAEWEKKYNDVSLVEALIATRDQNREKEDEK